VKKITVSSLSRKQYEARTFISLHVQEKLSHCKQVDTNCINKTSESAEKYYTERTVLLKNLKF